MKRSVLYSCILFLSLFCFSTMCGQTEKKELQIPTDTEVKEMLSGLNIEQQIKVYDSLAQKFRKKDVAKAVSYIDQGMTLAEQLPYSKVQAHLFWTRAKCFRDMLSYKKAIRDLDSALVIYTRLGEKAWVGTIHADIGNIHYKKTEFDKALNQYLKGLKYAEQSGDKDLTYVCLNNVGNIYVINKNYDKAIEYYLKSYDITKNQSDLTNSATVLDNIAIVYSTKKEFEMALAYSSTAAKIVEKTDNKELLAAIYMNLGGILKELKKYDESLDYFNKALKLSEDTHADFYISGCLINIGDIYRLQKKYTEAATVLHKAYDLALKKDIKLNIEAAAFNLSELYEATNQKDKALEYYKLYSYAKDSILNQESTSQMNELSSKYEAEKRDQEIDLLTKDKDLNDAKLKQKTTLNLFLFVGIGLIIVLLSLVFYRYREKQKANTLLKEKNFAINEQKELVIEKNREITDSINYARKIQDAMLPSQKILNEYFKDNFIFYQPKDIISGDFYWALRKDDKLYVAAADCTGHGVPGALMSMIGVTFLRQIVNEMNITDTAEILNRLHVMVLGALNEDVSERNSKDGMDVALLKIDLLNKKAQFTGAVRPLYMAGKNGFEVIKGDRFSIGGIKTMEESFSSVEIDLKGGRSFYLFSDGFADQFGQASGKKFMVKNLQNLLAEICKYPMAEQHQRIDKIFNDWKGTLDQTDDVLLVGIRV